MVSKNSEAQKCANTLGLSSNKSGKGNIDMNIVAKNELTFHQTTFSYTEMGGQIWLTASEIGEALGYADGKAVQRIYSRHADEFTVNMTGVVKVTTPKGMQESRVFSLRGAHLIAMFARTTVAKEFRRWVLDILDREVANGTTFPHFDFAMAAHEASAINSHLKAIKEIWRGGLEQALKLMEYKHRGDINERLADMTFFTSPLEERLKRFDKKGKIH